MIHRRTWGDRLFDAANYIGLTMLGIATLFPFLNMLAVSLNHPLDTLRGGIYLWPREFTWTNYYYTFGDERLYGATMRSVIRTVLATALGIAVTAMIAYALSRREFIFRKSFNFLFVLTLYLNAGLIPVYLLIKEIGLMNNFAVYILPGLVAVFNVMIMRSYFQQLPEGVVESAKIDGANDYQVLFRIIMPMSMPVVATIMLFIAVGNWNSWFDNYLYASRSDHLSLLQFELQKVLMQSIAEVISPHDHPDAARALNQSPESIRAAMTIVVTLPILLIYPFLQKYFVKGITIAAMKE
ncbi:carbohydrate ABC transporter permease [Paenibacillus sp.]|uniref:carbohydrate ABC transporter permease n=1 Tax=Paenibacillus sp. TaxID=58172 RepID=UPI002D457BBE|nr:carbohydrate ABC transporter permease [Paenibacillus sp.]HZG58668.1 carbohydrate ABC transporter permease [Paenibacillus sp.]